MCAIAGIEIKVVILNTIDQSSSVSKGLHYIIRTSWTYYFKAIAAF